METASVKANKVTASAAGASSFRVVKEKSGALIGGKPTGNAPVISMPVTSFPKAQLSSAATRLPTAIATIM